MSSYTNIQYVNRTYTSNWREYVPLDAHGIVVRPHTSRMGDVDTDAMSIVLDIISKLVKSIMTELCCESIMIYGIPTRQFAHLARSYKCHYIYPHEWDDDITDMNRFCDLDVYHYQDMVKSSSSIIPNSVNIVMSDQGYELVQSGVFILYLPSYFGNVICRNEFEMYMAIGLPTDIAKPYNSIEFNINESNISRVLKMIHVPNITMTLHHHPSLRAYIESV